jgi:hypothetical protein
MKPNLKKPDFLKQYLFLSYQVAIKIPCPRLPKEKIKEKSKEKSKRKCDSAVFFVS